MPEKLSPAKYWVQMVVLLLILRQIGGACAALKVCRSKKVQHKKVVWFGEKAESL